MRPLFLTALIASLVTALVLAASAAAVPSVPPTPDRIPTLPFAEEEEDSEAEDEVEEWEEDELEDEEEEAEPEGDPCPLRSARAYAAVNRGRLRLTIGYTTNEIFSAWIEIKQGSTRIDSVRRRFGHSGVLRLSSKLGGKRKHARFAVRIKPSSGGSECPPRRLLLYPR